MNDYEAKAQIPATPAPRRFYRRGLWVCWAFFIPFAAAQTPEPAAEKKSYGRPAVISTTTLVEFATLPKDRQGLIHRALAVAENSPWLPYLMGGAEPKAGGFDCSGAMYYVLRSVGLDPPRTSSQQFQWLKTTGRLHEVPMGVTDLSHAALGKLRPSDLLFWGRRNPHEPLAPLQVTHVALFLGTEKQDARPVMINSTDGRSYRGTRANGYGVYDFRLPASAAKISFLGYGTPPGIATD